MTTIDHSTDRGTDRTTDGLGLDMERVGAFAQQVADMLTGGATAALMVVGDRLGLYAALAGSGAVTSAALAERTGTHERYVREWLAQHAAVGIVTYDPARETFELPPEHAAVLATDDPPAAMIGVAPMITGMHRGVDAVTEAFRTGDGIGWGAQDPLVMESTERFFRVGYRENLVTGWIPALDGVGERLAAGAYVADVGCGHGAALILLAEAFPASRFVGFDIHEPSIETARERAVAAGVADRVEFQVGYCQDYPQDGYDLITLFDTFHDLGDPQAAARYARDALGPGGTLALIENTAGDDLDTTIRTVPTAALGYAASTFLCTPNSLSQPGRTALGSQPGPGRLVQILTDAGFGSVHLVAQSPFNIVIEAKG